MGHGLGWWPVVLSDMMSMSIRIGQAARWWCQVWVTASGMVAGDPLRHAVHVQAARWWCHAHRQGRGWPAVWPLSLVCCKGGVCCKKNYYFVIFAK